MRSFRPSIPVLLFIAALATKPAVVLAQNEDRRALTKSELVRLLVGGVYQPAEIAAIVRRNCLTFEPSARDRADLRDLGATPELMESIDECARRSEPLLIFLETRRLTAVAGDTVGVVAEAIRGSGPAAGVRLVIRGTETGAVFASTTGPAGRATLRLPVGTAPGVFSFALEAPAHTVRNRPQLLLRVTSGPPARVELEPRRLVAARDAVAPLPVRVAVRDRHGNPVSGVQVAMVGARSATGRAVVSTDSSGVAQLMADVRSIVSSLAAGPAGREGASVFDLDVLVAGEPMAKLPLELTVPLGAPNVAGAPPIDPDTTVVAVAETPAREVPAAADSAEPAAADSAGPLAADRARDDRPMVDPEAGGLGTGGDAAEAPPAGRDAAATAPAPFQAALLEALVWGGGTFGNGDAAGSGAVEVILHPVRALRLHGLFDGGLGFHTPLLVRGGESFRTLLGGLEADWGPGRNLTTRLEAGRREQAEELFQNLYHLEQAVRFRTAGGSGLLRVGGFFGRWFDRDDWVAYAAIEVPVTGEAGVIAALSSGETVGTNVGDRGRRADRDSRLSFGGWFEGAGILHVQPLFTVGRVESDDAAFAGTLVEGRLRLAVAIAPSTHLQLQLRHQRPPGDPAATAVAAGLAVRLHRRP